ncbi:MAG: YafY family transcriptional regulator [Candidatus Saccharibacteria bacterium]|nr:YafY family transcriptional regulator [Rhodoferax sp.]
MSDSARLYAYKALFEAKRLVTRADMMEVAEVSLATFKRDIAKLRDQMGMPILFDKDRAGYYLDRNNLSTEMPGLWFNPEELVALLTIQRLIEQLEPGLVGLKLRPLQKKLTDLLEAKGLGEAEIAKRVRMTFAGKRQLELKAFEQVALATISRKQVKVTHLNRERAERVERTISPQELVHYRDNWYIDAWCHLRKGIRSFGLDAIEDVQILDTAAKEVDTAELRRITQGSYGIFAGQATAWAVLRFTKHRAQWVEGEQWHPEQLATREPDGSYLLKVPYSDDRELLGDILRFGADVQVLEPKELRSKVQKTLLEAVGKYI